MITLTEIAASLQTQYPGFYGTLLVTIPQGEQHFKLFYDPRIGDWTGFEVADADEVTPSSPITAQDIGESLMAQQGYDVTRLPDSYYHAATYTECPAGSGPAIRDLTLGPNTLRLGVTETYYTGFGPYQTPNQLSTVYELSFSDDLADMTLRFSAQRRSIEMRLPSIGHEQDSFKSELTKALGHMPPDLACLYTRVMSAAYPA